MIQEESSVMSATANKPSPSGLNRGLITISVMLASFLQALDQTIANVALPRMGGELSATQEQISWVLTSYIVAAAIMIPLSGWMADRYGRKKVLVLSVVVFTVSSALCGLDEVSEAHDVHLWTLTSGMEVASVHVTSTEAAVAPSSTR